MNYLQQLPFLRQLDPVAQAKLLPDIQERNLNTGEQLPPELLGQAMYFVIEGRVELRLTNTQGGTFWIAYVEPEGFFGETGLLQEGIPDLVAIALQPSRLLAIPIPLFKDLLTEHPSLSHSFSQSILRRVAHRTDALGRARKMLASYSDQLWNDPYLVEPQVDASPAQIAAGTMAVSASRRARRVSQTSPQGWQAARPVLKLITPIVLACIIAFLPLNGALDPPTRHILAVLMWGSLCWLINALPDFVTALATCLGLIVVGDTPPAAALSGFASPTWFLLLGVWGIGAAVSRTGLLYRLALHILKRLPNTYIGQSLALAITGTVVSPVLPSSQGRIFMAAPLTLELGDAMRFSHKSNGSIGLAMSSFLGFGQMYFLFLNGTTTVILAWSLLPASVRETVTWFYWLLATIPLGLIVFALTYIAILRLYPVGPSQGVSPELLAAQIRLLGPLRRSEWIGIGVILVVLCSFVFSSFHKIEPAWFAIGGMLLLLATQVLTKEALSRDIDWSFLLFFGAVLGIATVVRTSNLDVAMSNLLQPLLAPMLATPVLAVLLTGVVTLLLRLALSPIQAIPLLTIALLPLFIEAGYNPLGAVLTIVTASTTFVAPLLSPNYMTMLAGTRERMFTNGQIHRFALVHSGILLLGLLATVPYWLLLGAL